MNKIVLVLIALALASTAACTPARSAHDEAEGEHHEALDPRLDDPAVIAAAARIKVSPGPSQCSAEVLGLVDVHEPMESTDAALERLRRRAALLGAESVVGVEFEHGEGGAEKTHLSGMAVRCNDLVRGRKYEVIGQIEATAEMEHEEEGLAALQKTAIARGANLILGVRFEHGDGDKTKVTGTAVRAYAP